MYMYHVESNLDTIIRVITSPFGDVNTTNLFVQLLHANKIQRLQPEYKKH